MQMECCLSLDLGSLARLQVVLQLVSLLLAAAVVAKLHENEIESKCQCQRQVRIRF